MRYYQTTKYFKYIYLNELHICAYLEFSTIDELIKRVAKKVN